MSENNKYLVISDIHGSNYYANKISEICKKENPDKIILLEIYIIMDHEIHYQKNIIQWK